MSHRTNYENQFVVFKRMSARFDAGGCGSEEIMGMMSEMQSFGQPPKEIMQELVPGLEFSQEGEPVLKDIPPEIAVLTGDQPNCSLM
jgi:hypothetical protein